MIRWAAGTMPLEAAAITVSIVALIVSTVSLVRKRRTQEKQLDLKRQMKEIADAQLGLSQQAAAKQGKAEVELSLRKYDMNSYRFYLRNAGPAKAFDVSFELQVTPGYKDPLGADYRELIPVQELPVGQEVSIRAFIGLGGGGRWPVKWRWRNQDGSAGGNSSVLTV
jgi:hypothetical protein